MGWKEHRKKRALRRMRKEYTVESYPTGDGDFKSFIRVPADVFESYTLDSCDSADCQEINVGAKKGLIQKIGALFTKERTVLTADAPDESTTTEIGAVGNKRVESYYDKIRLEHTRKARYKDYERMNNESTLLNKALYIMSSNTFASKDGDEESFETISEDSKVERILSDLNVRVHAQNILPELYTKALWFGDEFSEVVYDGAGVIVRVRWLNQNYVNRNEDEFGRLLPDCAFTMIDAGENSEVEFAHWQVIHLRHAYERGNLYGTSYFFPNRRPFRILQVMEDGVAINRFISAVDRLVFYIPVPKNADEIQVRKRLEVAKRQYRRRSNVDSNGRLNLSKAPYGDDEDFFIVADPESGSRIERLQTSGVIGQLSDVEYYQNLLVIGTSIPKAHLGLERDVNAKATLGWQDIQFARILRANQKEAAWWLRRLYNLQLTALGIPIDEDLYKVRFPAISFVDEEMKMMVERLKWEIAAVAKSSLGIPTEWLLKEIIQLGDDDINQILPNLKEPIGYTNLGMQQPPKEMSRISRTGVKEAVFDNMKQVAYLNEIRDMLTVISGEVLHKAL